MDYYKNQSVISAGDSTRQERKEKNMKRNGKRKLGILVMLLAITVTALPQQAAAVTASPASTSVTAKGPDLVAKYCDMDFKKLKDRIFLIPKNGKGSYAPNNLTMDKGFADLLEDELVITIKQRAGCSVKVGFSDPSVASCSVKRERMPKEKETVFYIGNIKSKKAGTTTMTITIRVGNSVKEYSCKLTFLKYQENPVKSFKVDKKNFASAFNPKKARVLAEGEIPRPVKAKKQSLKLKKKQNKVKINVKLKKGYKLKNIWRGDLNKKIKNGKKYKLQKWEKKDFWVYVEYLDKTNTVRSLLLQVKIKRK